MRPTSYQDVLALDPEPAPTVLRIVQPVAAAPSRVPVEVYTDRAVHEAEKEVLWGSSWQVACREEHIPEPGDQWVYDIADQSYLLVRREDGSIGAHPNACLHRGRRLQTYACRAPEIRCRFHAFTWNLDGTVRSFPAAEEFDCTDEELKLPDVAVQTWGGFVFINPSAAPRPFDRVLDDLAHHFERWPLEERYVARHVRKRLRCNWKIAQEAFMEVLHVGPTHPQAAWSSGDLGLAQHDGINDELSRFIMARGVQSPWIRGEVPDDTVLERMLVRFSRDPGSADDGASARVRYARLLREELGPIIGGDRAAGLATSELCDAIVYNVFPNFHPWGAFYRNCYLFRPDGDDHERSVMELMVLAPFAGVRPPPAPVVDLGVDDSWTDADIGASGRILDQDTANIVEVQAGLRTTRSRHVRFARDQEASIRHFYRRYFELLPLDLDVR